MVDARQDDLVREHLDLVGMVARQLARDLGIGRDLLDDLTSAGREGLVEAARRFDPDRGVPFRRFANYRVKGAIFDALRRESALPRRTYEKVRALEAAAQVNEAASEDLGGAPAPGTTAALLDARLAEHLAAVATAIATGLVATTAIEEEEPVAVDGTEAADERLARAEIRGIVADAVERLPDPERALVREHYFRGRRFDEVASELGLSKSWASRLHKRAIGRLTEELGRL